MFDGPKERIGSCLPLGFQRHCSVTRMLCDDALNMSAHAQQMSSRWLRWPPTKPAQLLLLQEPRIVWAVNAVNLHALPITCLSESIFVAKPHAPWVSDTRNLWKPEWLPPRCGPTLRDASFVLTSILGIHFKGLSRGAPRYLLRREEVVPKYRTSCARTRCPLA